MVQATIADLVGNPGGHSPVEAAMLEQAVRRVLMQLRRGPPAAAGQHGEEWGDWSCVAPLVEAVGEGLRGLSAELLAPPPLAAPRQSVRERSRASSSEREQERGALSKVKAEAAQRAGDLDMYESMIAAGATDAEMRSHLALLACQRARDGALRPAHSGQLCSPAFPLWHARYAASLSLLLEVSRLLARDD